MPFFEERVITDAIEINAPPEKAYAYITGIVDGYLLPRLA